MKLGILLNKIAGVSISPKLKETDPLDKSFVKELSLKLYEWTGERWIISFSKEIGQMSIKQRADDDKKKLLIYY